MHTSCDEINFFSAEIDTVYFLFGEMNAILPLVALEATWLGWRFDGLHQYPFIPFTFLSLSLSLSLNVCWIEWMAYGARCRCS